MSLFKMGDKIFLCSIGRNGTSSDKKEGDGTTPIGQFPIREIFYRADRANLSQLKLNLACSAIEKDDGWCDDVNSDNYNKYIKLPSEESHEKLRREDNIYDIIVVIGYNDDPIIKKKGSAIFLHIARENYQPTAGCIALAKEDLLKVIPQLTPKTKINIDASGLVSLTEELVFKLIDMDSQKVKYEFKKP